MRHLIALTVRTRLIFYFLTLLLVFRIEAQTTVFNYNGRLIADGAPATGSFELRFSLYDADIIGNRIEPQLTFDSVGVVNGLFQVPLDFGASSFNGADRWLEIEVRPQGSASAFTQLTPRVKIAASPYAIQALNAATADTLKGTISAANVTGPLSAAQIPGLDAAKITAGTLDITRMPAGIALLSSSPTFTGMVAANGFTGNGANLTALNADNLTAGTVSAAVLGNAWKTTGNAGTTAGTHFIGTTDSQGLEIRVNNNRALLIIPGMTSPNLLAGSSANGVGLGNSGSVVSGGGAVTSPNAVDSSFAVIAGGRAHTIGTGADDSVIGGGYRNQIKNTSPGSSIAGGEANTIEDSSPDSTIAGGRFNKVDTLGKANFIGGGATNRIGQYAYYALITGGKYNTVGNESDYSGIGSGVWNSIDNSTLAATIAGGDQNQIWSGAHGAFIGSGLLNDIGIGAIESVVTGGHDNLVDDYSVYSTIGGGYSNDILSTNSYSIIAGGLKNTIEANGNANVIGGGATNLIGQYNWYATIAGGRSNVIDVLCDYSGIGSGVWNSIGNSTQAATIAGGDQNKLWSGAHRAFIGSGLANDIGIGAIESVIAGGHVNYIGDYSGHSVISGGSFNQIKTTNSYAAIVGGIDNTIERLGIANFIGGGKSNRIDYWTYYAAILGGQSNYVGAASDYSTIGSGLSNSIGNNTESAVIAGGKYNHVGARATSAVIAGGYGNVIADDANHSMIPGGALNNAAGANSLAAGLRAKALHSGAFVWGDDTDADITSTANNQFNVRASGGVRIFSNGAATLGVSLAPNATAWSTLSDRNSKKDFNEIDTKEIMAKLAKVPIWSWHYLWEDSVSTRHIGPIAQDFKAAFYPGRDDKSISTLEIDGVTLAAIQGLYTTIQEKDAELKTLQAQNESMAKRLDALEDLLKNLGRRNDRRQE